MKTTLKELQAKITPLPWSKDGEVLKRVTQGPVDGDWNKVYAAHAANRLPEVVEALEAAQRIIKGKYLSWNSAGGPDECCHGYAKGIPCPKCDVALVESALQRATTVEIESL